MSRVKMLSQAAATVLLSTLIVKPAFADDLYKKSRWSNIAGDQKASEVGDVITVVVYQSAESRNAAQNSAQRTRAASGTLSSDDLLQQGELGLRGEYLGRGEVRRSESFVTQISVSVVDILPNGDLAIEGEQNMQVNGEHTRIAVRGRVRPIDINRDNQVLSTRIADAQIDYDGDGFVSRNSDSGPLGWLFSLLGLSG
jgi:flagellar L-ring protein precursor FlgH